MVNDLFIQEKNINLWKNNLYLRKYNLKPDNKKFPAAMFQLLNLRTKINPYILQTPREATAKLHSSTGRLFQNTIEAKPFDINT